MLYDATVWRRWLLQLLKRMGLSTHYRAFFTVWDRQYLDQVNRGRREYWEAFRAFLLDAGLTRGQADQVIAAGSARRRQLRRTLRPFPRVAATLVQLSSLGLPMGILSSGPFPAETLRADLDRMNLLPHFDAITASRDLGRAAPDRGYYRAAAEALDIDPAAGAFVGHDHVELAGAASAGLATIALNYDGQARADVYLDRIDQLPQSVCPRRAAIRRAG